MIKINKFKELNETYKGKSFKSTRKEVISELTDTLVDQKIFDCEISDVISEINSQILYITLSKKIGNNYINPDPDIFNLSGDKNIVLKLDLSECDMEFGIYDYETDEYTPKINLNTPSIKKRVEFNKTTKKFGL